MIEIITTVGTFVFLFPSPRHNMITIFLLEDIEELGFMSFFKPILMIVVVLGVMVSTGVGGLGPSTMADNLQEAIFGKKSETEIPGEPVPVHEETVDALTKPMAVKKEEME